MEEIQKCFLCCKNLDKDEINNINTLYCCESSFHYNCLFEYWKKRNNRICPGCKQINFHFEIELIENHIIALTSLILDKTENYENILEYSTFLISNFYPDGLLKIMIGLNPKEMLNIFKQKFYWLKKIGNILPMNKENLIKSIQTKVILNNKLKCTICFEDIFIFSKYFMCKNCHFPFHKECVLNNINNVCKNCDNLLYLNPIECKICKNEFSLQNFLLPILNYHQDKKMITENNEIVTKTHCCEILFHEKCIKEYQENIGYEACPACIGGGKYFNTLLFMFYYFIKNEKQVKSEMLLKNFSLFMKQQNKDNFFNIEILNKIINYWKKQGWILFENDIYYFVS